MIFRGFDQPNNVVYICGVDNYCQSYYSDIVGKEDPQGRMWSGRDKERWELLV